MEKADNAGGNRKASMEMQLSETNAKLYSKLFVSRRDIAFAQYCAGVLLKKGWHIQPWERRGTIYSQQAAFTSALIIAYGRPFTNSKGWPKLPADLVTHSGREAALHERLMTLRHTVYAHSDSANYLIRPWRSGRRPRNYDCIRVVIGDGRCPE